MSYKFNFDDNQILNHKFAPATKGYDALEVDRFFDGVIEDYQQFKKVLSDFKKLESKYQNVYSQKLDLEAKIMALEKRMKDYDKIKEANQDNFENIRRIAAYEKFLWSLGYDPKKIK
jgi:DivIVA domain-containing protein